jgi:hypothetical protein
VIALIAENTGHVKAVAEMTGTDLDPVMGRAIAADGVGTTLTSVVGGSPTTTYAENIGVMAATRVYSTAAYYRRCARRHHGGAVRHDRAAWFVGKRPRTSARLTPTGRAAFERHVAALQELVSSSGATILPR